MSEEIKVQEQQAAPEFTLAAVGADESIANNQRDEADLRGRVGALYFYPKDC